MFPALIGILTSDCVVEKLWCVYKPVCVRACVRARGSCLPRALSPGNVPLARLQTSLTPVQTDVFTSQEFTANKAVQFSCTQTHTQTHT